MTVFEDGVTLVKPAPNLSTKNAKLVSKPGKTAT